MKKNTYTIPLALVFCLFFLWAISSNLLPTMIRQLMKSYNDPAIDEDLRAEHL